jgi:hypothetical protein
VFPLTVVRFVGFHQEAVFGKSHIPAAPTFFFVVLIALSGVWNALLYRLTRGSIFQGSSRVEVVGPPVRGGDHELGRVVGRGRVNRYSRRQS